MHIMSQLPNGDYVTRTARRLDLDRLAAWLVAGTSLGLLLFFLYGLSTGQPHYPALHGSLFGILLIFWRGRRTQD